MTKKRIPYQKTLLSIATSMVRLKRPERLLKIITRYIDRELGLTHTSLVILEENKEHFSFVDSKGSKRVPIGLVKMDSDHPLVSWFRTHSFSRKGKNRFRDYLYRSDVNKWLNGSASASPVSQSDLPQLAVAMDNLKIEVVVPGYFKQNLLGLLLLGKKINGRPFTQSEISFFQILVQDCSMAIKTAQYHHSLTARNKELAQHIHEIEELRKKEHQTYYEIMRSLAQEVHAKDTYTYGHVSQVERLGIMTAKEMGLDLSERKQAILSAGLILHDVGKIGIPDHILKKTERLTEEEWKIMRTHPERGCKILQHLSNFKEVAEIVYSHHENFDGSGYPRGLKGEQIPIEARIVAVVDSFHAIVSTRCYSRGRSVEVAFEELKKCADVQFDPQIVNAFLRAYKREMKKRGVGFYAEDAPYAA